MQVAFDVLPEVVAAGVLGDCWSAAALRTTARFFTPQRLADHDRKAAGNWNKAASYLNQEQTRQIRNTMSAVNWTHTLASATPAQAVANGLTENLSATFGAMGRFIIFLGRLQELVDHRQTYAEPVYHGASVGGIDALEWIFGFDAAQRMVEFFEWLTDQLKHVVEFLSYAIGTLDKVDQLAYCRQSLWMQTNDDESISYAMSSGEVWAEAPYRLYYLLQHDQTVLHDAVNKVEEGLRLQKGFLSSKLNGTMKSAKRLWFGTAKL